MTQRKNGLIYLRITACFGIVMLHTLSVAEILKRNELTAFSSTATWAVLHCLRWAVPCFVMITGALLLDPRKELTFKKIYGKYLVRIILALVVFSFVYKSFSTFMNGEAFSAALIPETLKTVWTGTGWAHLWYLYTLIGLYLMLPFYRMVTRMADRRGLLILLGILLLFVSILPLCGIIGLPTAFAIPTAVIWPFYLFAGYAIDQKKLTMPPAVSLLLIIVSAALLVLCTAHNSEERFASLLSYESILVVIMAAALFSLFCRITGEVPAVVNELDRCCFGIYLIHLIFLRLFLRYWQWDPYRSMPALRFLGIAALAFILSAIITWILRKIPGVRRII